MTGQKLPLTKLIAIRWFLIYPFKFEVADTNYIPLFHTPFLQFRNYATVFEDFLEEGKGVLRGDGDVLNEEVNKSTVNEKRTVVKT